MSSPKVLADLVQHFIDLFKTGFGAGFDASGGAGVVAIDRSAGFLAIIMFRKRRGG